MPYIMNSFFTFMFDLRIVITNNKTKMKHLNLLMLLLATTFVYSQDVKKVEKDGKDSYDEDLKYEMAHKSQPWFSNMKDGVDYFEVKQKFDTYFGNHKWEKSKPRMLGESWIKSKLFYLDKNGHVQAEPKIDRSNHYNSPFNTTSESSTGTIGTWTMLGPVNSATTNYSGSGNHGGYVYLNRIDPTNNQKLFVSFVTGGLWMTADGGNNWSLVDSNMPDEAYLDLDVSISNPQIVYAISDTHVIKSTDGGLNWLATSLTSSNFSGKAYDIAVSTSNPNIVIARWGDKLYRTTDGGTTWSTTLTNLANHSIWDSSLHSEMLDWSTTNSNVVYSLSTNHNNQVKLHRSSDSGASFSQIATLTLDGSANGQVVGWAKLLLPTTNANSIYVAVGSGNSAYAHQAAHLYKLNAVTGVQESVKTNMITGIGDAFNHDPILHHGDICMDRNNENKILYGSYGNKRIHVSANNGDSFTLSTATTHSDIRTIDLISNSTLVGSDGETVLSTDDGTTLTTLTNSISNHELWGFGSAFKTDIVASGNNHGPVMIKEPGNGFDWYNGTGADQGNTDVNPLDDRYVYSQGYSNYRYFRTGTHTLVNETNYLDLGGIYSYFNSIEFHPNNYYTIITHHAGQYPTGNPNLNVWKNSLIKTEDNGNSISIVKTFANQVFREKISMKNPNHIYVVEGLNNNKLWHSSDSGTTWTDITPSTSASSGQTNISDIAVGDENANEVWVTYSGVQSVCKVLKSNNHGSTWSNLTQSNLTDFPMTKIIFQRGSNGGVYVGNKSGIYYRNNSMSNWAPLGSGLPLSEIRFMFINYNQNKLKIGTSRGAFSHELYEISPANALISASSSKIICPSVETVQFKDYSVIRNSSASWSWSFPGGTPATSTEENPEVSYANAADGLYDVTLTVTDNYGTSTQTLSGFIEVSNQCGSATPETIPGNLATLSGASNNDYLNVADLNLNKNSFTFSCWIKPNGIQEDYSAIFNTQDNNDSFAFNFLGGNNTLGFHPTWWWSSGMQAPANEWSHVAMVSNGNDVRIYVNGKESINNTAISNELFENIDIGRYGRGYTSRYTNMEIDEVSIWNRPLNIDEIRQWRHLTKSNTTDQIFNGLVAYYQFNESNGGISINKTANPNYLTYQGTSGNVHLPSNAPVFGGVSEKVNVNSSGLKDFGTTGLSMTFANGTYPNGDIWVSRSNMNPDVQPDALSNFNSYTIVNNYGINQTFTPLESIAFSKNPEYVSTTPANYYNLFKRNSNGFGNSWGAKIDTGDNITGATGVDVEITFSSGLNLDSFSQFAISNENATLSVEEIIDGSNIPSIHPIPLNRNNELSIDLPMDWNNATMILYNTIGQKITQTSLKIGNNKVKLNLSPGMYHAVIFNANHKFSKKLILN